jgi:PAS domain S-box-containing protein
MSAAQNVALEEVLAHIDEIVYQVAFTGDDLHRGRVTFVGGQLEALLGYRPEEFLGDPGLWARLLHPDDWPEVEASTRRILESRMSGVRTYRLLARSDRRYRWLEDRVVPQLDEAGAVVSLFGVARDITERRHSEDERGQFASALQQIADSVLITDRNGTIEFVNAAFETLTGYAAREAVGRKPNLLKSDKHSPEFYRDLWQTLLEGRVYRGEFCNRKKSGDLYLEEKTIAPILDSRGEPMHFASVGRDVTLRRQLEQRALSSQRLEAMGRLAGGVAHDFNNLLTVITGYADMLERQLPDAGELRQFARNILLTSERAGLLASQLLTFSRQEVSAPRIVRVADAIGRLQPVLERLAGPEVEYRLEPVAIGGGVHVDPSKFEQILLNLVVNARRAIATAGRITVTVDEVDGGAAPAHLGLDPSVANWVRLRVADDGAGMDEETRKRIFEPFFTTRTAEGGTGLGLAIVKTIVSTNHGGIDVVSAPGSGTTFTVYLPRVAPEPDAPGAAHGADAGANADADAHADLDGDETIMVVEDDDDVRRLVVRALRDRGYEVFEAADADGSLAFAETAEFDRVALVVSDLLLPRTSGDKLLAALRARRPELKALIISGYAGNLSGSERALPADVELLAKPFAPEVLARRIRELLSAPSAPARVRDEAR